ncbi:HNH endonuclease [Trifolium repens]|nr:HNH endonuclease [Trifolium repens]
MRGGGGGGGGGGRPERRRRRNSTSPLKDRTETTSSKLSSSPPPSSSSSSKLSSSSTSTTLLDDDSNTVLFDYYTNPNPRSFPHSVKQKCWEKADKVKGRDPDRWRRDPLGNLIFRKLVGCPGCLCHDYDHIVPYSKGGKSTLENCQVLQATVNRSKGNRTDISKSDLIQKSSYCRVSGRDMDLLELSAFGNVRHGQDTGGCRIQ